MLILKHNEPRIQIKKFILTVINIMITLLFVMLILSLICQYKINRPLLDIVIISSISSFLIIILGYYCVLNKSQRQQVLKIIKGKIKQ